MCSRQLQHGGLDTRVTRYCCIIIHQIHKTLPPSKENADVIVINTSDRPVKIHRNTHLGSIKTVAKTDLIVESMSNFVSVENCPDEDEPNLARINNLKIEQMHTMKLKTFLR